MTVKDRIKTRAKEKGLTLQKIESELHFGAGTISKWDKSEPSHDKLIKVADLLQVSTEYLMTGENDPLYYRIQRAREKGMSPRDEEKMIKILEASFEEYFGDNYVDEDTD